MQFLERENPSLRAGHPYAMKFFMHDDGKKILARIYMSEEDLINYFEEVKVLKLKLKPFELIKHFQQAGHFLASVDISNEAAAEEKSLSFDSKNGKLWREENKKNGLLHGRQFSSIANDDEETYYEEGQEIEKQKYVCKQIDAHNDQYSDQIHIMFD